ncbi:hypothetical protein KHS38_19620 [Mucilaginibacter sp. Bleaf8]|uniref:hypothetical protein n=1 Tax=Mucilaginibacter sp. Bleaf8 TaxID=2834430 RepID=UPI001BCC99AD|nr:hypothetical protein [Mucilaginibacter sp. Bleaf8]MBS7566624.1 hypothetical protein [Mucilaginibacter sp. Bleaf8]
MKLNDDLKTFLSVASYILFTFILSRIVIWGVDSPIIIYVYLSLSFLYLVYVSYQNVVYRLGKAKYLLFPTYNDRYYIRCSFINRVCAFVCI